MTDAEALSHGMEMDLSQIKNTVDLR